MNIKECFNIFNKYKSCLDTDTPSLRYISSLEIAEMIDDDNLFYVTPFFSKVCNYSLSHTFIDTDYIKDLSSNNKEYYDCVSELSLACCDYLNSIYDDGCIHPSVLRYDCIGEGVASYENLLDFLSDIKEKLTKTKKAKIFDNFYKNVVRKDIKLDDKYIAEMVRELNRTDNFIEFNKKISNYAFLYAMRKLLLADRDDLVTYQYNYDYHIGKIVRRNGSEKSLALIDLMFNLNKILEESDGSDSIDEIENAFEFYNYYNSYQSSYIRYTCSENKILSYLKQV